MIDNQTLNMSEDSGKMEKKSKYKFGSSLNKKEKGEEIIITLIPYVVLFALIIWLGIIQPRSFNLYQINNMVSLSLPLILVSIGQTMVILTGGLDLSVAGILSLVSIITAFNMETPEKVVSTAIIVIALSWLPGLLNGLLIVYGKIQPFIVTLATWFILGGIALTISPASGGYIDYSLSVLAYGKIGSVPVPLLIMLLAIIFGIWFQRTRLGYEIQSIGSDRESAFNAGVNTKKTEIIAYMLCSVFTTLGAIVLAGQSLSGDPKVGDSFIMNSFAAAAIGGAVLSGGWARIVGSIVGALALSYLIGVTYALGMSSQWALIFEALLLILSVFFQYVVHLYYKARREV